jgi:hypothetical protein
MEMKRGGHLIDQKLIGTVGGFLYEGSIGFDNLGRLVCRGIGGTFINGFVAAI